MRAALGNFVTCIHGRTMDGRVSKLAHLAEAFLLHGKPELEVPGRNQDIAECSTAMLPETLIDKWYRWPLHVLDRVASGCPWEELFPDPLNGRQLADILVTVAIAGQKGNERRRLAAIKLIREGPGVASHAARLLEDTLGTPDALDQELGCRLASLFGRDAVAVLPRLMVLAQSGETRPRLAAIDALADVRSDDATPVLIECLADKTADVQAAAAAALAWVPDLAAPALPILHDLLAHRSTPVRVTAAFSSAALALVRPASRPETMFALRRLVDDRVIEAAAAGLICRNAIAADEDASLLGDAIRIGASHAGDSVVGFLGKHAIQRVIEERTPRTRSSVLNQFYSLFYEIAACPNGWSRLHEIIYHPWLTPKFRKAAYFHAKGFIPKDVCDAIIEEARQEFAVVLLRSPLLGMAPDEFRKLSKFVENKISDVVKQVVRRVFRHKESWMVSGGIDNIFPTRGTPDRSPVDEVQYQELQRRVADALKRLTPGEIELLQSRAQLNETWAETAAAMGISQAQAQRRFAKVRVKMAKALDPAV